MTASCSASSVASSARRWRARCGRRSAWRRRSAPNRHGGSSCSGSLVEERTSKKKCAGLSKRGWVPRRGSERTAAMDAKKMGYWTATGLLAFFLASGGAMQLVRVPANVEGVVQLGYPVYVTTIVGFWKVLGAVALLWPRLPRLKEWAYAGAFFELTGAAASHAFSSDASGHVLLVA